MTRNTLTVYRTAINPEAKAYPAEGLGVRDSIESSLMTDCAHPDCDLCWLVEMDGEDEGEDKNGN